MSFTPNSSGPWRNFDDTNELTTNLNETDHATHLNKYYFYETEQFTVLWILFALIVFGNSSVIIALSINKRRKSRMNFFIKQLAYADLSVGLISVPTDIIWRKTVEWNAGNIACKVIRFVQVVVTYSSTYVLVALSIDRYDAITHPMNFTGSWKRARLLVALAWIVSVVFSAPILVLYREETVQGHLQCWIDFNAPWKWQVYMTLVAATLFVCPALIISFCYTVIVSTIWAKSKHLSTSSPGKPLTTRFPMGSLIHQSDRRSSCRPRAVLRLQLQQQQQLDEDHDCRRASSRGLIPKAKVKTVKMTFVIVFVFILCWSPYIVFDLLQVFGHIPPSQTSIAVASFIQSLAPLNSAANPLIYCLFSTSLSRTLSKWLRVVCPWCSSPIIEQTETETVRQRWSSRRHLSHLTQTQNNVFLRNRKTCDALVVDAMAAAVVTVV